MSFRLLRAGSGSIAGASASKEERHSVCCLYTSISASQNHKIYKAYFHIHCLNHWYDVLDSVGVATLFDLDISTTWSPFLSLQQPFCQHLCLLKKFPTGVLALMERRAATCQNEFHRLAGVVVLFGIWRVSDGLPQTFNIT